MYCAAIGKRRLTKAELKFCRHLGHVIAKRGCTIQTGAAEGCDQAFAIGALKANGNVIFHLPWRGYEIETVKRLLKKYPNQLTLELLGSKMQEASAYESVKRFHPYFKRMASAGKSGPLKLHARNWKIICHPYLVDFVLAFPHNEQGSTMQGIRIAEAYRVPIIRMDQLSNAEIQRAIKKQLKEP